MKLIPSTLGYAAIVDDADFEALSAFKWYAHNSSNGEKRPARRTSKSEGRKVLFLVHHIVRAPHGKVVDHINGNPWDNRRENLRVCTNTENLRNRRKHGGSSTNEFKGVFARSRRWLAIIMCDGVQHDLGSYPNAKDAARAYDDAALYLHGDFARLNFNDGVAAPRSPEAIKASRPPVIFTDWAPLVSAVIAGEPCTVVARRSGVSVSGLCKAAREAGVPLRRGRPTLEAIALRRAA